MLKYAILLIAILLIGCEDASLENDCCLDNHCDGASFITYQAEAKCRATLVHQLRLENEKLKMQLKYQCNVEADK
jgi:hypothetical protein